MKIAIILGTRPGTVDIGANVLVGCGGERIVECVREMIEVSGDWANPYEDGKISEKIMKIIQNG